MRDIYGEKVTIKIAIAYESEVIPQVEKNDRHVNVSGKIWMHKADKEFLASDRIALLEKIREHGSITKAAKAVGISYKTAWEIIDTINNLSDKPLVVRMTGGRGGGGTHLTREGATVIDHFRTIQKEHEKFLGKVAEKVGDAHKFYKFIRSIAMKVSARNLFKGTVSRIQTGSVNSEVELSMRGMDAIIAIITNESVENLDLAVGKDAYAIVKSSSVIIGKDLSGSKISARNRLSGRIINVLKGAVNTEVTLEMAGQNTISAMMTNESAAEMGLRKGDDVYAIFKASSVIIGVE
jgi:molybdate transport system regulatory protein